MRRHYVALFCVFVAIFTTTHACAACNDNGGIAELIRQGCIEAEVRGVNVETMQISIRRAPNRHSEIKIAIPSGTFFVAKDSAVQNMITISSSSVTLVDEKVITVNIAVACANFNRKVPSFADQFEIRKTSQNVELEKTIKLLSSSRIYFPTVQAAIWIVANDAKYDDLGILASVSVYGRSTVIGPVATLEAMKILNEGGIILKKKRIWILDRKDILADILDYAEKISAGNIQGVDDQYKEFVAGLIKWIRSTDLALANARPERRLISPPPLNFSPK